MSQNPFDAHLVAKKGELVVFTVNEMKMTKMRNYSTDEDEPYRVPERTVKKVLRRVLQSDNHNVIVNLRGKKLSIPHHGYKTVRY